MNKKELEKIRNDYLDIFDYNLPVNIITINKTIKELYEMGVWCELWD